MQTLHRRRTSRRSAGRCRPRSSACRPVLRTRVPVRRVETNQGAKSSCFSWPPGTRPDGRPLRPVSFQALRSDGKPGRKQRSFDVVSYLACPQHTMRGVLRVSVLLAVAAHDLAALDSSALLVRHSVASAGDSVTSPRGVWPVTPYVESGSFAEPGDAAHSASRPSSTPVCQRECSGR